MELNKFDVEKSLLRKGFIVAEGDHEFFLYKTSDGTLTGVRTKLSRGSQKGIGDPLINKMCKQCRLSKGDFVDLVSCRLDQTGYENILRETGAI